MLSVALLVAADGVDPNEFKCLSESPTTTAVYSNTATPVALTHIFCGEIDNNGRAVGFHSRYLANQNSKPGGTNYPPCARATGKLTCSIKGTALATAQLSQKCVFASDGIEVLNKDGKYVKKTTNQGNPNYFFPDSWKPILSWNLH